MKINEIIEQVKAKAEGVEKAQKLAQEAELDMKLYVKKELDLDPTATVWGLASCISKIVDMKLEEHGLIKQNQPTKVHV